MSDPTQKQFDAIAGGEGQAVEFKSQFPLQARDLAKEVAAFASSNEGLIFIGINDDGSAAGVTDTATAAERDGWQRRIQGMCASIKPPVMADVSFPTVDGCVVVCIRVPKGSAPLYYVQHVPYVRHLSASRPAEPQEVIDLVLAWAKTEDKGPSPEEEFLGQLASQLVSVIVRTAEVGNRERRVNPWLDELRSIFGYNASDFRRMAVGAPAALADIAPPLEALADHLDEAAHQRLTMGGGWDEYSGAAESAHTLALTIKRDWIESRQINAESVAALETQVASQVKALAGLAKRAEQMMNSGRGEELQREAGSYGFNLLQAVAFGLGLEGPERREAIAEPARRLRELETRQIYMDGGQSADRIVREIGEASAALTALFEGAPETA